MSGVAGLVGLIAAFVVGKWLLGKIVGATVGAAINTADRAIRRPTHQKGRAEASTALQIAAPVPVTELLEAIITRVNAHAAAPAVVQGLYLADQSDAGLRFAYGSKAGGDSFLAGVDLEPSAAGSMGTFEVLTWKESGADIYGRDDMTRLRDRVADAVRSLGGSADEQRATTTFSNF